MSIKKLRFRLQDSKIASSLPAFLIKALNHIKNQNPVTIFFWRMLKLTSISSEQFLHYILILLPFCSSSFYSIFSTRREEEVISPFKGTLKMIIKSDIRKEWTDMNKRIGWYIFSCYISPSSLSHDWAFGCFSSSSIITWKTLFPFYGHP